MNKIVVPESLVAVHTHTHTHTHNSFINKEIIKYEINKTANKAYNLGFVCCFLHFLSLHILELKFKFNIILKNNLNTLNYILTNALNYIASRFKKIQFRADNINLDINILILNKNKNKVEVEIS